MMISKICDLFKKTNILILFFFLIYCVTLKNHLFSGILRLTQTKCYMHSNWLVNYRGGFIRRGLGGEIILRTSSFLGISPITTMTCLSLFLWIALIVWFVFKFHQKHFPLFFLSLPFFLGETILLDPSLFLRQDSLILLIFTAMLSILTNSKKLPKTALFIAINLLFIFGILIHEVVFFVSFPILFLSCWHKKDSFFKSILFFLPAITIFILCFILPETSSVEKMFLLTPGIERNDIWFMTITTKQNFAVIWENASKFAIFYVLIIFVLTWFVSMNFEKLKIVQNESLKINKNFLFKSLLLQFISILPLYTCAWDWGRWIFLWIASSFICFIIADKVVFERKIFSCIDSKLSKFFESNKSPTLMIFSIAIIINPQHCLPFYVDFYKMTPLNLVFRTVVRIFSKIFSFTIEIFL